jgi:hypothetical protein
MKKYLGLWIVALLVLGAASAWAYPTLDGVSGLVTVPTAEVTPTGAVDLAVDYTKIDWWSDLCPVGDTKMYPVRINAGVAENLELSGNYTFLNEDDDVLESIWSVGAKYAFLTEAEDEIGLAISGSWGNIQTDDEDDDVTLTRFALAFTKSFPVDDDLTVKATAGAAYLKLGDWFDESYIRPYVGLELVGEKGANLGLEYRWKDSDIDQKSVFSAVLRLPLMPDAENSPLWLEVGSTNGSIIGFDDQDFFGGLCYRFMSN